MDFSLGSDYESLNVVISGAGPWGSNHLVKELLPEIKSSGETESIKNFRGPRG